jgi:hypothetical protein
MTRFDRPLKHFSVRELLAVLFDCISSKFSGAATHHIIKSKTRGLELIFYA